MQEIDNKGKRHEERETEAKIIKKKHNDTTPQSQNKLIHIHTE